MLIEDNTITAVAPGDTTATAKSGDTTIAKYKVKVSLVPIEQIIMSSDTFTLKQEETQAASYMLMPANASDYGLIWKSANEEVAVVDEEGNITGVGEGNTTVVVSSEDGAVSALFDVIVEPKSAYDQLSQNEQEFIDALVPNMQYFKNPSSVQITAFQGTAGMWFFKSSAENGFGGTTLNTFWLWQGELSKIDDYPIVDQGADLDLLTQALHERYGS